MDTASKRSNAMNGRDLIEVITKHGASASEKGEKGVSCTLAICPHCHGRPDSFSRHGARRRLFFVFAFVVLRVRSNLTRWKCPLCGRTCTQYPDFALPFKRYTTGFIASRCAGYVGDDARTYAEGVEEGEMPICHEDPDDGGKLWPSTLWRWVATLGGLPETVGHALELIKQKDPSSALFRALGARLIRAGKFRSEARKGVLQRCLELLLAAPVYARLFEVSLFPDLATGVGWR